MGDSVVMSDSLVLETSWDCEIYVGAWWFETVIAGTEWDPVQSCSLYENIKSL